MFSTAEWAESAADSMLAGAAGDVFGVAACRGEGSKVAASNQAQSECAPQATIASAVGNPGGNGD